PKRSCKNSPLADMNRPSLGVERRSYRQPARAKSSRPSKRNVKPRTWNLELGTLNWRKLRAFVFARLWKHLLQEPLHRRAERRVIEAQKLLPQTRRGEFFLARTTAIETGPRLLLGKPCVRQPMMPDR